MASLVQGNELNVVLLEDEYHMIVLESKDKGLLFSVMTCMKRIKGMWRMCHSASFQDFMGHKGEQPILLLASLMLVLFDVCLAWNPTGSDIIDLKNVFRSTLSGSLPGQPVGERSGIAMWCGGFHGHPTSCSSSTSPHGVPVLAVNILLFSFPFQRIYDAFSRVATVPLSMNSLLAKDMFQRNDVQNVSAHSLVLPGNCRNLVLDMFVGFEQAPTKTQQSTTK